MLKAKPIEAYGLWVDSFGSEDKVFIPDTLPYKYIKPSNAHLGLIVFIKQEDLKE
jgi:hypothetical protein